MKNILIPTNYRYDTLHAMKKALWAAGTESRDIILVSFSPLPGSLAESLFLTREEIESDRQSILMQQWDRLQELTEHAVTIRHHHQYGSSRALLTQIIERFGVGQVIIPFSFQHTDKSAEQKAFQEVTRFSITTVLMPARSKEENAELYPVGREAVAR